MRPRRTLRQTVRGVLAALVGLLRRQQGALDVEIARPE